MHEPCSQPTEAADADRHARGPGLTRRAAIRIVLGGAGTALLAACAPTSPSAVTNPTAVAPPAKPTLAPTPAPAPAAAPVSAPATPTSAASTPVAKPAAAASSKTGGTLRVGTIGDIITLDGHNSNPNQRDFTWSVFDQLTTYDLKLQPQPGLAESWELSPDLKQIKLNLRKGVQWHSGRDFTSDDVNYNLMRVRDPKLQVPSLRNQSNWFTGIEVPDKFTIILTSEQPRPAIFDFFQLFNQVDKDTVEGAAAQTRSIGTGPFVFQEWAQGDHLSFSKNANYWKPGVPNVDTFIVYLRSDAQAMLAQFEAGTLDAVRGPAPRDFARYNNDPAYRGLIHPAPGGYFVFGVNTLMPPLDNKKVRQALNYALDRTRFADLFLLGTGTPASLPWPSVSPAFEAAKQNFYPFDLDKAEALLEEAGVSGLQLELIIQSGYTELVSFAPIFQADLAKIGINISLTAVDIATLVDQAVNVKYKGLILSDSSSVALEPSTYLTNSRQVDPNGNNEGYKTEKYSQLVTTSAFEPDLAKRKAIYAQINDLLLDESFLLSLSTHAPLLVEHANVQGIEPSMLDAFNYYNALIS